MYMKYMYRSQVEGSHWEGFFLIEDVCLKHIVSNVYIKITEWPKYHIELLDIACTHIKDIFHQPQTYRVDLQLIQRSCSSNPVII